MTKQKLKQIVEQVEWNEEDFDLKLQDIKHALDFVTNDQYRGHGQLDYDDVHYDNLQSFFEETNNGESCDWSWEEVIAYWTVEDIDLALEDWEDAGCPSDQDDVEQAYEELEAAE